jgi:hypothetical protein
MGVVVNFDERTVSFLGYVARINEVDAANVSFGGKQIGGRDLGFNVTVGCITHERCRQRRSSSGSLADHGDAAQQRSFIRQ